MPARRTIPRSTHQAFLEGLQGLEDALPIARGPHVQRLLSQIDLLTDSRAGQELLLDHVPALVEAGFFAGGAWEDPGRLVPALVAGTLGAGGQSTLMEIVSELRMLAIAEGRLTARGFPPGRAREFLEDALVASLELVFPGAAPTDGRVPITRGTHRKLRHLMAVLTERIPPSELKEALVGELELLCLQRPIVTDRALRLLAIVRDHMEVDRDGPASDRRLSFYLDAAFAPSEQARRPPAEYDAALATLGRAELEEECRRLGRTLKETGLATPHHALLLRRVADRPALVRALLALDAGGRAELEKHRGLVEEVIADAIHPGTARACYGLGRLLERSLLSRQPVRSGLEHLLTLEAHPDVARSIDALQPDGSLDARQLLLADVLGVLGQPLGVGQGSNPTCQSARGISLWSRHAPGKLLGMVRSVARTGELSMRFEGQVIRSSETGVGLAKELVRDLDAVSVVLVPHLDRIYNEMMRRATHRGEDPHKWVNPAMYGQWIPTGFLSAYDYATNTIRDYERFLRTFYATHHPEYNRGHDLAYPNPVGVFLTSTTGALIGFHAVSILRVRQVKGRVRVFLYNPNNEGRQRWHADIRPTVAGHGERPGESSLPFEQFASRVYAYHFNPSDLGELEAVDAEPIRAVTTLARESWGRSYQWTDPPPAPVPPSGPPPGA